MFGKEKIEALEERVVRLTAALEVRDVIIESMLRRLDAIERGGAPRVGDDEIGMPSAEST